MDLRTARSVISAIRVIILACVVALPACAKTSMSHPPAENHPYPLSDVGVALPSGTVVRLRDVVVLQSGKGTGPLHGVPGNTVTLYIETPTPSTEPERLAIEARELLGLHETFRPVKEATVARVGICRTRLCLEMREIPQEIFSFVRRADGSWTLQERPESRSPLSNE